MAKDNDTLFQAFSPSLMPEDYTSSLRPKVEMAMDAETKHDPHTGQFTGGGYGTGGKAWPSGNKEPKKKIKRSMENGVPVYHENGQKVARAYAENLVGQGTHEYED